MSSGAKVVSHIIPEVMPGVTPTGTWDTLRLTGNAPTPTVNTQVSDEITDTGLSQGSVATSIDIGDKLTAEFSFGSFDQLLEAAFYGNWTGNVLSVGDTRHTFSIAKGYDVGVYGVFKGAHVSTFVLDIPSDGKTRPPSTWRAWTTPIARPRSCLAERTDHHPVSVEQQRRHDPGERPVAGRRGLCVCHDRQPRQHPANTALLRL